MSQKIFLAFAVVPDGGFSVYSNPEIDKLISEARGTVDDTRRGEIIKKAVRMAHEDVPIIPICNLIAVYEMKKDIDFTPTQKYPFDIVLVKDIVVKRVAGSVATRFLFML